MTLRRPVLGAIFLVLALAGATGARAGDVRAQEGVSDWRTVAGGDEVLSLAIDPFDSNRLLAGTEGGGLVEWDLATGEYQQRVYPTQPGLLSNDVRDIVFDARGRAWLATPSGVVLAGDGSWRTYGTDDGLPTVDITAVAVGEDGEVWAGTYDDGVAVLADGAATWQHYEAVEFLPDEDDVAKEGPGEAHVLDIAVSPIDGRVWLAHGRKGTYRPAYSVYDPTEDAWYHLTAANPGDGETERPPSDQVLAVEFDDEGRLWSGAWRDGVLLYDIAAGTWQQWTDYDGVCGTDVWDIDVDGTDVWVACAGGDSGNLGAAHWDGTGWWPWGQYDVAGEETGIPTDEVRAIANADGIGFIGTNGPGSAGSGIAVVENEVVREVLTTAPDTPPSNDITAMAFDPSTGDLWAGARDLGLMHYDGASWELITAEDTDELLRGNAITDLLIAGDRLWVASTQSVTDGFEYVDGGVSVYDLAAEAWLDPLDRDNSGLPDNDAGSLALDADGRLWIGLGQATGGLGEALNEGDGVAVYDVAAERFDEYFIYNGLGVELPGDTVLDLAAKGPEMWVGASYAFDLDGRRHGGGVGRYAGGAWTTWGGGEDGLRTYHGSGEESDTDPYITGEIGALSVALDGTVYVGAWDLDTGAVSGVWPYVDAVVNRWDDGAWVDDAFLGDGWISALAEDGTGLVWAGTTRGHDEYQEADLLTKRRADTASGGAYVWDGLDWTHLTPHSSGLASNAIRAMAVEPATGDVWIGFENGGFSVFETGQPLPTPTVCVNCPTPTPRNTAVPQGTAVPPIVTNPPRPTDTVAPGAPTSTPLGPAPWPTAAPNEPQPPPEVPEPGTLLLVGAGLAGLAGYAALRRRRAGG